MNEPAFPCSPDGPNYSKFHGLTIRDWFAGHETLAEWDHPNSSISNPLCEALAGKMPAHGWGAKTADEWRAILAWDAKWRAELKYIRADAMLRAREAKP